MKTERARKGAFTAIRCDEGNFIFQMKAHFIRMGLSSERNVAQTKINIKKH